MSRRVGVVSRRVTFQLLKADGRDTQAFPVPTVLWWSAEEPYKVGVIFQKRRRKVEWLIARELFAAGLDGPAGAGDVQLFPCLSHPSCVELVLDCPSGRAGFRCRRDVLRRFLDATFAVVPAGCEVMPESWFEGLIGS